MYERAVLSLRFANASASIKGEVVSALIKVKAVVSPIALVLISSLVRQPDAEDESQPLDGYVRLKGDRLAR